MAETAVARIGGPSRRAPVADRIILAVFALGAVAVTGLAVALAPAPVILNLPLVAHASGLLAGYAVTVLIVLMARVPVLERTIGADRMARWHARIGKVTIVAILVHAVAATLGWAEAQMLSIAASTDQVLMMPGLVAATISTILFLVIGATSARAARRRMPYETWHALHTLTYVAIALAFAHELAGPDLAGHPLIQVAWSCCTQ
ncbi:ferric reductase-like transmembrane domain-containing protein [Microbacterium sp. CJ88]|uniref:ferric reductase-like transmembrane domain-containing protein n=1 Tax=Microbacterium sp. CJ88 TaxID=3445672 RepID=UPI003F65EC1C